MSYTGAPYNFIPVTEPVKRRYQSESELPKQNEITSSLHSGEIHCRIQAKTDILIGGGASSNEKECRFYRTADGSYAIPGSTLKGLIRSNMQVLGFGSLAGDVEDYEIMYRMVGASRGKLQEYYTKTVLDVNPVGVEKGKTVTVPKNVKAGYITKEEGEYRIYRTRLEAINKASFGEMNYYPVYEPAVMRAMESDPKTFPAMYKNRCSVMQHNGKADDFHKEVINGKVHVRSRKVNQDYIPYQKPVYYKLGENRKILSILDQQDECPAGYLPGAVISTGKMNEKKTFYVIPERDSENYITIPKSDVESFQHDYENKKRQLPGRLRDETLKQECKKFFELPKGSEVRPVFYIEKEGRLYFGYTPFLRIFYKHHILEGLSKEQKELLDENGNLKEAVLDYPSSILGYSTNQSSYRSRVFFGDMKLNGKAEEKGPVTLVLGEPKLSSYYDYLEQKDGEDAKTYNDDDFQLRGTKQYWLHEEASQETTSTNSGAESQLYPLSSKSQFEGVIRFLNLSEDELGLLLWSLSLTTDSNQNIGHAKPYGYGRIQIMVEKLLEYNYSNMYSADLLACGEKLYDVKTNEDINEYIVAYKNIMGEKEKKYSGSKVIQTFLRMKNTNHMPPKERIQYMSINNRDYKNRSLRLPTPLEVTSDGFYKNHPEYGIIVAAKAEKKKTVLQDKKQIEENPQKLVKGGFYQAVIKTPNLKNTLIKVGKFDGEIKDLTFSIMAKLEKGKKVKVECIETGVQGKKRGQFKLIQ